MNTINPATLSNINGGGVQLQQSQSEELRNSFMTLLITQLQNQDPLKPMEKPRPMIWYNKFILSSVIKYYLFAH